MNGRTRLAATGWNHLPTCRPGPCDNVPEKPLKQPENRGSPAGFLVDIHPL